MEQITGSTKEVLVDRFEYVHTVKSVSSDPKQCFEVPGPISGSKSKNIQWSFSLTLNHKTIGTHSVCEIVAKGRNTHGKDENLQVEVTLSSPIFHHCNPQTVSFDKCAESTLIFKPLRKQRRFPPLAKFTFQVVIFRVSKPSRSAHAVNILTGNLPLGRLQTSLKSMLDDGEATDVTIETSDGTINAHKTLLSARSPVFRAMFSTNMLESSQNKVQITDFNKTIVSAMLEYVYTGYTDAVTKDPNEMLQIADKYDLEELREACVSEVTGKLKTDNAISNLVLADLYQLTVFKGIVMQFFKANHLEIAKCADFKEFVDTKYELYIEALTGKKPEENRADSSSA